MLRAIQYITLRPVTLWPGSTSSVLAHRRRTSFRNLARVAARRGTRKRFR